MAHGDAPHVVLWLPAWSAFGRQRLDPLVSRALGRADARHTGEVGLPAQAARVFTWTPSHWAPAALTRQADVGDAAGAQWLRADPAHVRPDLNGARLLGIGERLSLDGEDVAALLPALRPIFGDAGFALDAPVPSRWYLRLPRGTRVPRFSDPDAALGEDLFDHQVDGPEARRWRAIESDVQVTLHNHPWNERRRARGLVPINALWFWGSGEPPAQVTALVACACSDDDLVRAFATCAGGDARPLAGRFDTLPMAALHDLRRMRDLARVQADWLLPALAALEAGTIARLVLDADDGQVHTLARGQRWRFWRRPWAPKA